MAQRRAQRGAKSRAGRPATTGHDAARKPRPAQPSADEQSGSAGRRAVDQDTPRGADTGQDRYGQSGFSGTPRETMGQARYRRSGVPKKPGPKPA